MALSPTSSEFKMLSVKNTKGEQLKERKNSPLNPKETLSDEASNDIQKNCLLVKRQYSRLNSKMPVHSGITAPKVLLLFLTLCPAVSVGEKGDQGFSK